MKFLPATESLYANELIKYFSRMPAEEVKAKCPRGSILEKYLKNAEYCVPPGIGATLLNLPINVYFVINSGIEYDYPHTLGFIVIIPKSATGDITAIVNHELVHIYFRNFASDIPAIFCKRRNIKKIIRPRLPGEITNPDTYYNTGLPYENGYIYIALLNAGPAYEKKYCFISDYVNRPATREEVDFYNKSLPYDQNYHPEEIIAEIITASQTSLRG